MRFQTIKVAVFLTLMVLISMSCKPKYNRQVPPEQSKYPDQESIFRSNQKMIKENSQSILDKAVINGWDLTQTGTGVLYQKIGPSNRFKTDKIRPKDRVALSYRLNLLDGTECYNSKTKGLKEFFVDQSEAETGLHEVVKNLYPGDSALIIIPPYRGFGLSGDGDKIPPRAILVYHIRIESVIRHPKD
jgi:FKBP-type peptidyl-prolyl cis-trans isomerase